ncbi:MAG: hypothetical protein WCA46_21565 [Actinocatenispora sp.]
MRTVTVELDAGAVRDERLDRLCGELAADLRGVPRLTVRRATVPATEGTKAGVVDSLSTLLVSGTFSVALVRSLRDVLTAFVQRSQARSVTVRHGDVEIQVTGASRADVEHLTARFDALAAGPTESVEPAGSAGTAGPSGPADRPGPTG